MKNYRATFISEERQTLIVRVQAKNIYDAEVLALEKFDVKFPDYHPYNYELFSVESVR
jgi:hypothetical protein